MTRYFFLHMEGCSACESQRPVVDVFCSKHVELKRVDVDLSVEEWKARAWTPSVTPTHVLWKPGRKPSVYEGEASLEQLDSWLEAFRAG